MLNFLLWSFLIQNMSFQWFWYIYSSYYQLIICISNYSWIVFENWMRIYFLRFLSLNPIFEILGFFDLLRFRLDFFLFVNLFSLFLLLRFDFLIIFLDLINTRYFLLLLIIILDLACKLAIKILTMTFIVRMSMLP